MREEGVRFLVLSSLQSALLLPVKETQKTEAREEGGGEEQEEEEEDVDEKDQEEEGKEETENGRKRK